MSHNHSLNHIHEPGSLITHDRRTDSRRRCRAIVWQLDDELVRATELGAALDISRGGLSLQLNPESGVNIAALRPGCEWLVMLDDPSGLEPLADQRVALVRVLRTACDAAGRDMVACAFVTRRIGRCVGDRRRRFNPEREPLSDALGADMLDELADRVGRDLVAAMRAESK